MNEGTPFTTSCFFILRIRCWWQCPNLLCHTSMSFSFVEKVVCSSLNGRNEKLLPLILDLQNLPSYLSIFKILIYIRYIENIKNCFYTWVCCDGNGPFSFSCYTITISNSDFSNFSRLQSSEETFIKSHVVCATTIYQPVIWGGLNWKTCGYCCYPFLSSHKNEKKKSIYQKKSKK